MCGADGYESVEGLSYEGVTPCCVRGWKRNSLVAMAEGTHPYPSRTRRLSPPAPRVLGPQGPGRLGRCQANKKGGKGCMPLPPFLFAQIGI